ncbi:MAG TPA: cytochrome b5 domain-containing protein [Anaerolineales bacterium]
MEDLPAGPDRIITLAELRRHAGEDGPMYIAFQGIVYDVSGCAKWRTGLHEGLHFPGQDLTDEFDQAPHSVEVFQHPCVRRVGRLNY